MKIKTAIAASHELLSALLNSYGMLFFSRNKVLSVLVLVVSFFVPYTGISGLVALLVAISGAKVLGFEKSYTQNGMYTYSSLLFGLGLGTNFESGTAFVLLLIIGSLVCLLLSVILIAKFSKHQLPALSLPFIFSTWLIILASKEFTQLGLSHRHIYWYNETYALGGQQLVNMVQTIENWPIPDMVAGFFRSLSAILFQVNVASGILLSIGLLFYSRIAFMLMVYGYAMALCFNYLMGGFDAGDMTYYNMGTNFMLVAMALGGFYVIPSVRSFTWLLFTVPVSYLLVVGLGRVTLEDGLPVFSLPFCIVVIAFAYAMRLRTKAKNLVLTPVQYYSPEINMYRYLNSKERLMHAHYQQISLPFWGSWMVSQGYDGSMTHKGDWSKALDFVILDQEMKTYRLPGLLPEHFYAFNKPVVAPADGFVIEAVNHIEDNEIGKNNTTQNWGNTVVIKHAEGLYSKLSHLKKHSITVQKGSYVKKGDVIGNCGNSGRSPEPHLHMQIQATPYIGSKTMAYPLSLYWQQLGGSDQLKLMDVPVEGSFVCNVVKSSVLQEAMHMQPGFIMRVSSNQLPAEEWEVLTTPLNELYLYCRQTKDAAYFINNDSTFYFTNYFGSKKSLLFHFYCAAYKVVFSTEKQMKVTDLFPVHLSSMPWLGWLQDMAAPFYVFTRICYNSNVQSDEGILGNSKVTIQSAMWQEWLGKRGNATQFTLRFAANRMQGFTVINNKQTIEAICEPITG